MRRLSSVALLAGLTLFSLSCNVSQNISETKQAITHFHEQMDSEQYTAIYRDADDLLRKKNTEKDLTAILAGIHRKLGAVQKSEFNGVNVNATTQGTFIGLIYKTHFAEGDGTETFRWHVADNKCKLVSYYVNSAALVLN